MIFGLYCKSLVRRVEARPARNGEAPEHTAELESEIPVSSTSIVKVYDERSAERGRTAIRGFSTERFIGASPVSFGFV